MAGGARPRSRRRALIEHSIGPVWEANHVWLIFVIVLLWTGFPSVFAAVMSTLYIPLTLVALGIIARGAAFAFRKADPDAGARRAVRAWPSPPPRVITPFFLGRVAGAVASGRVPAGIAAGDLVAQLVEPDLVLGGRAGGRGQRLPGRGVPHRRRPPRPATELAECFRGRALATGARGRPARPRPARGAAGRRAARCGPS